MQEANGRLTKLDKIEDATPGRPVWQLGECYDCNGTVLKLRKITKKDLYFRPVPDSQQ